MTLHRAGWIRLGVVLSILWLIGCAGYLLADYRRTFHETAASAWDTSARSEWQVRGQEGRYFDCTLSESLVTNAQTIADVEAQTTCSPVIGNVVALVISIPLLLWGAIPLLVVSFLWVRAGFRGARAAR